MKFITALSAAALMALVSAAPAPGDEPNIPANVEVALPDDLSITGVPTSHDGAVESLVKKSVSMDLAKRATLVVDVWMSELPSSFWMTELIEDDRR